MHLNLNGIISDGRFTFALSEWYPIYSKWIMSILLWKMVDPFTVRQWCPYVLIIYSIHITYWYPFQSVFFCPNSLVSPPPSLIVWLHICTDNVDLPSTWQHGFPLCHNRIVSLCYEKVISFLPSQSDITFAMRVASILRGQYPFSYGTAVSYFPWQRHISW